MDNAKKIEERISNIVWISRQTESGGVYSVLTSDEYIQIETELIELFNHKTEELQKVINQLTEYNTELSGDERRATRKVEELQKEVDRLKDDYQNLEVEHVNLSISNSEKRKQIQLIKQENEAMRVAILNTIPLIMDDYKAQTLILVSLTKTNKEL